MANKTKTITIDSVSIKEANDILQQDEQTVNISQLLAAQAAICKMESLAQEMRAKLTKILDNKKVSLKNIAEIDGSTDGDKYKEIILKMACTGASISGIMLKFANKSRTTISVNETDLYSQYKDKALADGLVTEETRYKINTSEIKKQLEAGTLPSYCKANTNALCKLTCKESVIPLVQPNATK